MKKTIGILVVIVSLSAYAEVPGTTYSFAKTTDASSLTAQLYEIVSHGSCSGGGGGSGASWSTCQDNYDVGAECWKTYDKVPQYLCTVRIESFGRKLSNQDSYEWSGQGQLTEAMIRAVIENKSKSIAVTQEADGSMTYILADAHDSIACKKRPKTASAPQAYSCNVSGAGKVEATGEPLPTIKPGGLSLADCVRSDLIFLDQVEARVLAKDESIFKDKRGLLTSRVIRVAEQTLDREINGAASRVNALRMLARISELHSCDEIRNTPSDQWGFNREVKADSYYSNKCLEWDPDNGPMPTMGECRQEATSHSSSRGKREAFEKTLESVRRARVEILRP